MNKNIQRLCLLPALLLLSLSANAAGESAPLFPQVAFETTVGTFVVQLDGRRAPLTTKHFLKYVQSGHYNGTIFHRVITGFMAQAGGFDTDLTEKPTRDSVPNESGNGLSNVRGTLAMARTGAPHSGTAQFFVNLVDNQRLDPSPGRWGYAVFGKVADGMDVVNKIKGVATGNSGFHQDVPTETVEIQSVTVSDAYSDK